MIETIAHLAAHVGAAHDTPESIARRLYKDTDCGICCSVDGIGVTVAGYAEGSDADCQPYRLDFPFSEGEFDNAVEAADQDGCEAWEMANTEEEA